MKWALLKMNKSLVTFSLIFIIIVPIFGFNFLVSLMGNLLLIIFLIPLLIFLIILISFNSLKSKVRTCNQCGNVSLGINSVCINCGADLDDIDAKKFENLKKPSETVIEVKAEEIKWLGFNISYQKFNQFQFVLKYFVL